MSGPAQGPPVPARAPGVAMAGLLDSDDQASELCTGKLLYYYYLFLEGKLEIIQTNWITPFDDKYHCDTQ